MTTLQYDNSMKLSTLLVPFLFCLFSKQAIFRSPAVGQLARYVSGSVIYLVRPVQRRAPLPAMSRLLAVTSTGTWSEQWRASLDLICRREQEDGGDDIL